MAENLDPNIIDELNRRLSELSDMSNNLGGSFSNATKESNTLAASFKNLNAQVTGKTKLESDAEKVVKERIKAEQEATKTLVRNSQEQNKIFQNALRSNQGVDAALNTLQDRLLDMSGGSKVFSTAIEAGRIAIDGFITVLKAAYDAEVNYTKAILAGERGQQVVAKRAEEVGKAFNSVIDQIGNFLIGLGAAAAVLGGPLGIAFGAAAAAAGTAAKMYSKASNTALEFATQMAGLRDKLYQGFSELAKASMAGAGGMTQVERQLATMQMSISEVSEFASLVRNAGKEIRLFGARTTDGLENFAQTAGKLIKSDLGRTLEIMGITAQDQREHTLEFMTMQARFGMLQGKSVTDLGKSAGNYILEMDRLAELTGATRKEQEDARKQIMSIQELRAKMLLAKTPEEQERLKFGLQTAEALSAAGLKGMGAGLAKFIAGGGAITGESAPGYMAMPELFKRTLRGQGTVAGNIAGAAPQLEAFLKMAAQTGQYSAEAVKDLVGPDGFGPGSDLLIKLKNIPEEAKKSDVALREYLSKNREVTDKQTAAQVDLIRSQREKAIMDQSTAGTFNHAVGLFADAVNRFKGSSVGNVQLTQGETAAGVALDQSTAAAMAGTGSEAQVAADVRAQMQAGLQGKSDRRKLRQQRLADPLAGLNFKNRAENTGGGSVSPALLQLAYKIQEEFPGATFTALNDLYHHESNPRSKHTIGKALDFSLSPPPKDVDEAFAITRRLQALGGSTVLDEYFKDKTAKTTGGHFHVEVAHGGGMFTGMGDFPVLLKNNEYVLTQGMVDNLRMQMGVEKTPIESVLPEATGGGGNFGKLLSVQYEASEKLDRLISAIESGVSIQDKMLRYARS